MSLPQDVDSYVELVLGTRKDRALARVPLAFLVDGDNASARLIKEMLAEASKYGTVIIRNVYGDWTSNQLAPWKETMQEYALEPKQQFANVSGKNATDSAMIIDAMDILNEGIVKGFCIVSSDSDYTALARRIRRAGYFAMGIGKSQTPVAFQRACDIFVATENLAPLPPSPSAEGPPQAPVTGAPSPGTVPTVAVSPPLPRVPLSEAIELLKHAFDSIDTGDGVVHLANLGATLYRLDPAFDARTYGKPKLVDLIQAFPDTFAVERRTELGLGAVYVRRKKP